MANGEDLVVNITRLLNRANRMLSRENAERVSRTLENLEQATAGIAEHLADRLKQAHGILSKTEGKETGDWVLIDAGDVIVHVFRPEVRDFYQLEKMWLPSDLQAEAQARRREGGA